VVGNNRFCQLLPASLAILLAWSCAVCPPFLIPGWRRGTDSEKHQLYRSAVLFPAKIAIPVGVFLGGNLINGVILAVAFAILFLLIARLLIRRS
jgi:hypothetical protein